MFQCLMVQKFSLKKIKAVSMSGHKGGKKQVKETDKALEQKQKEEKKYEQLKLRGTWKGHEPQWN